MWPLQFQAGPVTFVAGVNHIWLPPMKGGCDVTKSLNTVSDISFLLDHVAPVSGDELVKMICEDHGK